MIESEKMLERKLAREIKKAGGWSLKFLSTHITGLPDRICMFPGGRICFVEVKTTGEKPNQRQAYVHKKFRKLGFKVFVVDSSDDIKILIALYE